MNWTKFQTYGMAPHEAFEVLYNQVFENWCKEEYKSDITSIRVVNGAGGDGGAESYLLERCQATLCFIGQYCIFV